MKNILFFALTITIGLTACKKIDVAIDTQLNGKWELRQLNSGFTGKITNYSAGNGHTFIFSENNYKIMAHDTLEKSGTFTVVNEVSMLSKKNASRIIYDNDRNTVKTFLEVNGNTLSIFYDAYDGGSKSYQRIDGLVID
jgi:hypothetical protein